MIVPRPASAPPATAGDGDLVRRCRAGDREAADALARRHRRGAYLLALQLLGDPDDALDAAQDSLLRLFQTLDRYDDSQPLRPWLFSIVRNRCRDLLRRRNVRRSEPLDGDEQHWRPELVDPAADPHRDVERRQVRRHLWRALADLPAEHREILVLREYQDLSYEEIAAVLRIPKGTVMSRLHRARKQLALRVRDLLGPTASAGEEP